MKKVIFGSLVAMMAVSAANAEIASVEYVAGKTGDIAQLTTTANSNLTAAVNELNTGVKAAATKTELSEGLATKQATITDLADIRSGAAAGATALQQDAIAADGATVADTDQDKVAPSITRMINTINDLAGSGIQDVADELGAYKTANDTKVNKNTQDIADINTDLAGKADKATTLAGYGITDAMTATQINTAIATATEDMATTGDVSTAKDAAIEAAAADATTKANAAKDAAIAAAAEAAKIYIDATELEQSQTAQNTALQGYTDGKVQDLQDTLTSLATFPVECAEGTSDCALVIRDRVMKWEKVQY